MPIIAIEAELAGVVFKIDAQPGSAIAEGEAILTLESMKMEIPVTASRSGNLVEICVSEGDSIQAGDVVARIEG